MADAMDAWIEGVTPAAYWRALCPALAIEGPAATPLVTLDHEARSEIWNALLTEGYWQSPGPIVPRATTKAMAEAVRTLAARDIHPTFLYMYDEPWQLAQWFGPYLETMIGEGFVQMPELWTWRIGRRGDDAGWPPHRDRDFTTLLPSGMPRSVSVWLPLTDATPRNGCMYVVPACDDPTYKRRAEELDVKPQTARALPAEAGSFLAWNQAVVHWGGRASVTAPEERISVSNEYQRGIDPPFSRGVMPAEPPPYADRLRLIGEAFHAYEHMYDPEEDLLELGRRLAARPRVA